MRSRCKSANPVDDRVCAPHASGWCVGRQFHPFLLSLVVIVRGRRRIKDGRPTARMVALPGATALKKTDEFSTGHRLACVNRLVLRTYLDQASTEPRRSTAQSLDGIEQAEKRYPVPASSPRNDGE